MCAPACRGRGRVVGRHTDRGGSGTHMGPTTRTTRDHMQSKHSHHLVSGLDGTVFAGVGQCWGWNYRGGALGWRLVSPGPHENNARRRLCRASLLFLCDCSGHSERANATMMQGTIANEIPNIATSTPCTHTTDKD